MTAPHTTRSTSAPELAEQLAGVLRALATAPQPASGREENRSHAHPEHRSPMDERSALEAERDDLRRRSDHIAQTDRSYRAAPTRDPGAA